MDNISILAIKDYLISKLSTLFRSSNILKISSQNISRLVGETRESSLERKRLEAKYGILETRLEGLKSLHKRRNIVNPPKQDQVASEDLEETFAITRSRSKKASIATNSAEAAPRAIIPDDPSYSPERAAILPPVDEWPP